MTKRYTVDDRNLIGEASSLLFVLSDALNGDADLGEFRGPQRDAMLDRINRTLSRFQAYLFAEWDADAERQREYEREAQALLERALYGFHRNAIIDCE